MIKLVKNIINHRINLKIEILKYKMYPSIDECPLMEIKSKIVFEENFGNLFNEIWLSKMLFDFWHVVPWNPVEHQLGMMFKLHPYGSLSADELDELKPICEPCIVTRIVHSWLGDEIYFKLIYDNEWKNKWSITQMGTVYVVHCTKQRSFVEIKSIE
jgi:hypothetical protein